ncbi:MAG: hypothetical protein HXX08_18765 [Chloroflexi bacterium]|uniref:Uncharacterized protein n=1 Tax=Candidatus Chlorohelix allophototropha TaxID=3003348 RepID=A0A8T7M778_9CHLR|nr:hypothetical protein [Chloroflexota bacterium]WJW69805.1 hypothetical protein OZ401_003435 [Chloroflexota bacterium L227-S17]
MAKSVNVDKKTLATGQKAIKTLDKQAAKTQSEREAAAKKPQTSLAFARYSFRQRDKLSQMPNLLKVVVVLLAMRWFLGRRDEAKGESEIAEAIKFLRESRGFQP